MSRDSCHVWKYAVAGHVTLTGDAGVVGRGVVQL